MKVYQHKVQYYETDKMGIVHHSNYIRWMEEARIDFLDQIGWNFKKLEDMGLVSPVTAVDCKYKVSTMFGDTVDIMVSVEEFKGIKLKLRYEMKRDGKLVCEGRSEHCFMNGEGRILNMKREYPAFYEVLNNIELCEAYSSFLQEMKEKMGDASEEFLTFKNLYTRDFQKGVERDNRDRRIVIQGDRLVIREANIADAEFMSSVERDEDNSPWVANWSLGWRVAKFGDADFCQVIIEREDGVPIGFIIFRDMLTKEKAVQLKRIALIDKGKGYGKEALRLAQKIAFEIWSTKCLYLGTKLENLRAQSIYKATGFIPDMPDPCTSFHMDREDYYKCKNAE